MSIPPLVCSTPPPPDQCEDDKDPEDFDLQYNLSQEDDDENYDYGSFSTYSHCQRSPAKQISSTLAKEETEISVKQTEQLHNGPTDNGDRTIPLSENRSMEEEINIEDLNLEVDEAIFEKTAVGTVDQTDVLNVENEKPSIKISDVKNEINIPSVCYIETDQGDFGPDTQDDEFGSDPASVESEQYNEAPAYINELIEKESIDLKHNESNIIFGTDIESVMVNQTETIEDIDIFTDPEKNNDQIDRLQNATTTANDEQDDDFGDFDDFQFATTSNNEPSTVIDNCDNPLDSNEATDNFGDFKATFNQDESIEKSDLKQTDSKTTEHEHSKESCNQVETKREENDNDDDDFGDFDDFKSSAEAKSTQVEEPISQQIPMLNLQATETENQIMESINKVLSSVFLDEIPEPEVDIEDNLEGSLGIIWAHLLEVDTRQPYIVNWNNSLGQKTLLKALGIDSRNILFGPKWSQNTPKYAANLTAAPLQPQKQQGVPLPDVVTPDKPSKTTWNDPFTSDGQEFTYAEALLLDLEHLMATLDQMTSNQSTLKLSELLSQAGSIGGSGDHPPIEIGPTDLDVFEASTSTTSDKIYSSTLNVQPVRQINLPDTHIFTPTDSETPRSKTIHYESPTILLPQTSIGSVGATETVTCASSVPSKADADEEWDFQDFKGPTTSLPSVTPLEKVDIPSSASLPTSLPFGTQVLQPIKLEPTIPTLNWPEPGEVKETFDDFSDFVSNTALNEKLGPAESGTSKTESVSPAPVPPGAVELQTTHIRTAITTDDEFDTFQSALPPKSLPSEFSFNSNTNKVMPQPQKTTELDPLPITNQKSDPISYPNHTPNDVSGSFLDENLPKGKPVKSTSAQPIPPLTPSLLQPTPASTASAKSQNSSQILQPLSLESYSQINWPNPGIDLQDLSRFNPVETLHSLKSDLSANSQSKGASPVHSHKSMNHQVDDDWGEFVSSKPKPQANAKKPQTFDDEEWSDFVSSPSAKPQNGLNTISLNVHTNLNVQKIANQGRFPNKNAQVPFDIPTLNYVTPKTNNHQAFNDRHFQNL